MQRFGRLVELLTTSMLYGHALPPLPEGTTANEIRQALVMAEHRAEVMREGMHDGS